MIYEGKQKLGDFFTSRREKGEANLPTLSVTLNDGLVQRDSLERRTETNLESDEHLLVHEGDIAYNMMRMWQGAFGLARSKGIVSPAYIVLKPKKNINSEYAYYLFKTKRFIHLFWAYSYGLTSDRLRLYFNDFSRIPATVPSLEEQTKIAKILSAWDKAIQTVEALIENSKKQKKALMQQLLTGKKRFPGFCKKWHKSNFSDLASLRKEKYDPKTSHESRECIELEHVEQETSILLGSVRTNKLMSTKNVFKSGDILFGKLRPYLRKHWLSDKTGVCSTEIWVLKANKNAVLPEYLFQLVKTEFFIDGTNVSSGTHMPRADWKVVKNIAFNIPEPEEQQKISYFLSCLDSRIEKLQKYIECINREKICLMQQLLSGKRRVKIDAGNALSKGTINA